MARKSHQTHIFRKAARDQTPGPGGDPQSVSYGPGLSISPFLRRGTGGGESSLPASSFPCAYVNEILNRLCQLTAFQ